jgi:hypothetical protein
MSRRSFITSSVGIDVRVASIGNAGGTADGVPRGVQTAEEAVLFTTREVTEVLIAAGHSAPVRGSARYSPRHADNSVRIASSGESQVAR